MTTMAPVLNAFSAANNGKCPYLLNSRLRHQPEQQAALRQVLQMNRTQSPNNLPGDKAAGKHDPSYELAARVCQLETAKNLLMKTTISRR